MASLIENKADKKRAKLVNGEIEEFKIFLFETMEKDGRVLNENKVLESADFSNYIILKLNEYVSQFELNEASELFVTKYGIFEAIRYYERRVKKMDFNVPDKQIYFKLVFTILFDKFNSTENYNSIYSEYNNYILEQASEEENEVEEEAYEEGEELEEEEEEEEL